MRKMQSFEFFLFTDVKAALPNFKGLSKPFTKHYAKLALSLFDNFSFFLPMPSQNLLYVKSKQFNVISSVIKKTLPALKNEAINVKLTAIKQYQNYFVVPVAPIYKNHALQLLKLFVQTQINQDYIIACFYTINY